MYIDISVNKRFKYELDNEEYFQREGFTESEIKNIVEQSIREEIWNYIYDNDIKINIDV